MRRAILILGCVSIASFCQAGIIIVDDDGPADFNTIQAAINDSGDGDTIYVFPGTYAGQGNRDIDFGGRAITVQSVAPEDPYIVAATVIDCNGSHNEQHRGFNFQNGEDANSILSGLTITNGYADDGGAITCHSSDPTISNCTMTGNSAEYWGGAIYCSSSMASVTSCTITDNSAGWSGGGMWGCYRPTACVISGNGADYDGGGLYRCERPTRCIVTGNSARSGGGLGTCSWATRCVVIGNSASDCGGGLSWSYGPTGCLIACNSAQFDGGGICHGGEVEITDCTVAWNTARAGRGGGIFNYGHDLTNCILWANTDSTGSGSTAQLYGGSPDVSFSCIQDEDPNDANIPFGGADNNNIDDYPMFVRDPNDGGDGWDAGDNDDYGDLHLKSGSPCINAGDPFRRIVPNSADIDGEPRVMGLIIDIGADEFLMPTIIVTRPEDGEVWASGSWREIKWESAAVTGTVDIAFSSDNGGQWTAVENNVANTGSYSWHLPSADSNQCLISIVPSTADPNGMYVQSGLFAIGPYSPGPDVPSKWKTLGGDFDRRGLSEYAGPDLGCIKWQFETNGAISASITVGPNDTVYVPCEDGNLYALDPNGALLWTYNANAPLMSAATLGPDATAYVADQDGRLHAIDIDGNVRWTCTTGGFIYSSPAVSPDGNNVYVASADGKLYALGRDGSELWSFETAGYGRLGGSILASPAVGPNGTVYIAGMYDPNLYALEPNSGSVRWNREFQGWFDPCDPNGELGLLFPWPFAAPVIADDGTIYLTMAYDPNLYAIDPNDGAIIWATNLSDTETGLFEPTAHQEIKFDAFHRDRCYYVDPEYNDVSVSAWSEPALGPDGTIYVSFDDQYLRAVEPNGVMKWATKLPTAGSFSLTVGSDGLIYAAGDQGFLYVVAPNGLRMARFESSNWPSLPVISADNTLIVADSKDNTLLINYTANKVSMITADACQGEKHDLHWYGLEDLNADGKIDYQDVGLVAADWLQCNDCSSVIAYRACSPIYQMLLAGDVNKDRYVNFADVAVLAHLWLIGY